MMVVAFSFYHDYSFFVNVVAFVSNVWVPGGFRDKKKGLNMRELD